MTCRLVELRRCIVIRTMSGKIVSLRIPKGKCQLDQNNPERGSHVWQKKFTVEKTDGFPIQVIGILAENIVQGSR